MWKKLTQNMEELWLKKTFNEGKFKFKVIIMQANLHLEEISDWTVLNLSTYKSNVNRFQ